MIMVGSSMIILRENTVSKQLIGSDIGHTATVLRVFFVASMRTNISTSRRSRCRPSMLVACGRGLLSDVVTSRSL